MQTARIASIAFLALIFPVAALGFPTETRAASGNVQVCQPSSSCEVGEFLYNDSYVPITSATCTITSRYPDGTLFLDAQSMTASAQSDGWYSKSFTTPATTGIYRTQVCCTSGSDYLCLDKSFEAKEEATTSNVASAVWNSDKSSYTTAGTFGAALQNTVPSSGDIASATWGYSSRSLSTFNSLVSDLWGYSARTLTGAGLTTGYLATQSDVTNATSNLTTITNNVTNIQDSTNTISNLIESVINKPVIENSLEDGNPTLESKITSTQKQADQLTSKINYLKSKTALIDNKWNTLTKDQIVKSLGDLSFSIGSAGDSTDKSSVLGASAWIGEQWQWQEAAAVSSQAKALKSKLASIQKEVEAKGKSAKAKQDIKSVLASVNKIQSLIGTSLSSSKEKTVYNKINEVKTLAKAYDSKTTELVQIFVSLNKEKNYSLFLKPVEQLSKDVAVLNLIPKIQKNILSKIPTEDKSFKNKVLSLIGMINANKQFLAKKPEDTLSSTWLELGSIVFKTLITNPSTKISQDVPVKYYLPKEIKRENILEIDKDLTVNFDAEKDQFYTKGDFTLGAGESKTLSIRVDDAMFSFNEEELNGIKKQAEELSAPLKNTSYFAQGATLKGDIDVSINKILSAQKSANTPEEKIRAFREDKILLDAVTEKTDKLKEIAASAGSVNTLFGFVGGAQVLAVWGLVIILVAGFVSLALYLRMIKNSSIRTSGKKGQKLDFDEEYEIEEKKHKGHKAFKLASILIISVVSLGLAGGFGSKALRSESPASVAAKPNEEQNKAVLGAVTQASAEEIKGEEVKLFVPEDSSVTIHKEANLDSDILITLNNSQSVTQMSQENSWIKIGLQKDSEKIIGWVDADFIETKVKVQAEIPGDPKKSETTKLANGPLKLITVSDTPTGFLRVRTTPGGKELNKVDPGKKYPVLDSKNGWLNILMDDGTSGWVSSKYTDFNSQKPIGGQIAP